jgi:sugar lactone lactonase YvrE
MLNRIGLSCFAVLSVALSTTQPAAADGRNLFPDTIALPNGFRPEGIAIGRGATIFAGSIGTGAVFAADLVTGKGSVLVPPQPGRAAIGLSFDPRSDLIYVAGGPTGQGYAYSARTGETVAVFQFTTDPSFINDQIVTDDAVFFTNSLQPVLYKVPLSRRAQPRADAVTTITLGGDFVQVAGTNNNGIVATPGGRFLIVVNTAAAQLFRVDPDTGDAKLIDLGGASVTNGDGLMLRGDDLFVVQNRSNQIERFDLDRRFERAELKEVFTNDRLDVPTTIDSFFGVIYVVNARFNTPPTADTTYTIEKVRRSDAID